MRLLAINAAVCAAAAAIILAGVELWLRLTVPAPSDGTIFEYTLETARYKLMKPSTRVLAWGKELRTNDLGFRDEAATVPAKQPGEFRVIVLGDSFTVSGGVDYRNIYTSLLEQRLRKSYPRAKVVNLAVSGYNPIQYELVLREVGLSLQPDMVLVALFPDNDFSNETYEHNFRVASGREPAEPVHAWYERLYVFQAYLGRIWARLGKMLGGPARAEAAAGQESAEGWEKNVAALQTIADVARRQELALAVAVLPHTWHFDRQRPLFARVEKICREHGLGCLDLLEPFIARRIEERTVRLNPLDAHPNEKYNAVVAEELAPHVAAVLRDAEAGDGLRLAGPPGAPEASGAQ